MRKTYEKYLAESVTMIPVKFYDKNGQIDTLYTATDRMGKYSLTNSGAVFFTDNKNDDLEIHGKPHSNEKELYLCFINGKLGIYDSNMKMKHGPFKSFSEAKDFIEEKNIKIEEI